MAMLKAAEALLVMQISGCGISWLLSTFLSLGIVFSMNLLEY